MPALEVRTDRELAESYRLRADSDAMGELFKRYHRAVLYVCLKYMQNGQEAEDAAYETFCSFQISLRSVDIANVKFWLYQAARNQCLMRLRSKVYEFESLDRVPESQMAQRPDSESVDPHAATSERVDKALMELDERQRRCIQLFYYEHKTHREIGDLLHINLDQVRSHLQNGKRKLRMILERKGRYERSA